MKKLSDKARMYARSYGQPPYGRGIEGTAELLLQIADRLDEYEVLEKQGKILRLPCALGDTVYHLCTLKSGDTEMIEMKVGCIEPCGAIRNHKEICEVWNVYAEADYTKGYFKFFDFGKTVFPTREEAEAALKELREV